VLDVSLIWRLFENDLEQSGFGVWRNNKSTVLETPSISSVGVVWGKSSNVFRLRIHKRRDEHLTSGGERLPRSRRGCDE
jgi:hypothetical protein